MKKLSIINFKILLLIIIFVNGISFSQYVEKISLEESLQLGLANSKELKISSSKVNYSEAKVSEINSQFLPSLSFDASYSRLSDVPPFEVSVPLFPTPIKISDPVLNNYNLRLSMKQPLFTGFRLLSTKKAAEYNYTAAEYNDKEQANNLALRVHTTFWSYYKAEQIKQIIKDQINVLRENLDNTRNFMVNGLATRNDVLKLEVQYSNANLKLADAENTLNLARVKFNQLIGVDWRSPSNLIVGQLEPETKDIYSGLWDDLYVQAHNNSNILWSMDAMVKSADENISAARSSWFPQVYLFGDYYYSKPNQRIQPLGNKFYDTWDVGVALNWEIWNWGLTSSRVTQSEELKFQSEMALEQYRDKLREDVYAAYFSYKTALDKINVSKLSVEQADENYRITFEKYNQQLATSSDLIDAETSLSEAKINYTNTLVDYQIAKVQLDKLLGKNIY